MKLVFNATKDNNNMYHHLDIHFKDYDNNNIPVLTSVKAITESKYNQIKHIVNEYIKHNSIMNIDDIELFKENLYNKLHK